MNDKEVVPLVSIVIVNYNNKDCLDSCINSVLKSDYPNFEVIVVDNGSQDRSWEFLKNLSKSNIIAIRNDKNLGPSKARNQGIQIAKGKYVAFLDNDTAIHPSWLKEAIKVFEADNKIGACQCKLILSDTDDIIDCVGEYLGQNGFLVNIVIPGEEKDIGQYDDIREIFAAKSAGMIARKDVLCKIKGFDDDYFIYMEESDLCWKIWLRGYKVILIPNSIIYHKFGTTSAVTSKELVNYNVKFHGTKNYISTLIKNLGAINFFKIIPIHLCMWGGILFFFLFKLEFKSAIWILQGIFWNIKNYKQLREKRIIVQKERTISDKELFPKIIRRKGLQYFIGKLINKKTVGYAKPW